MTVTLRNLTIVAATAAAFASLAFTTAAEARPDRGSERHESSAHDRSAPSALAIRHDHDRRGDLVRYGHRARPVDRHVGRGFILHPPRCTIHEHGWRHRHAWRHRPPQVIRVLPHRPPCALPYRPVDRHPDRDRTGIRFEVRF